MGADNTFGETNFADNNNCQGEWLNDCPYVECKCALNVLDDAHELEEDYDDQAEATSKGLIFWIAVFAIIVIIALVWLGGLIF
jgi:hypothetical protein